MKKNSWMTDFYQKKWLEVQKDDIPLTSKTIEEASDALIEWRIDAQRFDDVLSAQKLGFELVESIIEFESDIKGSGANYPDIKPANEEDLEQILHINHICMIENERVQTRFKNTKYFTQEQCEEYYRLSVTNNFTKSETTTVVAKREEEVVGFYMIKTLDSGKRKGIITGVLPEARGSGLHIKMQDASFNYIGGKLRVINTTQLNNFGVIKNHIREQRTLSKIEHIFYKLT